jgi:hypothetical protein
MVMFIFRPAVCVLGFRLHAVLGTALALYHLPFICALHGLTSHPSAFFCAGIRQSSGTRAPLRDPLCHPHHLLLYLGVNQHCVAVCVAVLQD